MSLLPIREHRDVLLSRKSILSTSCPFRSPEISATNSMSSSSAPPSLPVFIWEPDQTGTWVISDSSTRQRMSWIEGYWVRFRNKAFSNEQVGTFEADAGVDQLAKDEAVISGLAILAMVQSINHAGMVMLGGS
ncbi:hypothetical protein KXV64_001442 [Aspergillus fumigatus]|nr:hypothetical protein KXW62_002093 [Aspergillus fumigatus]KAH3533149.1 hypothetical protein KXV64_001442 [Aspergillus fumigatus]